MFLEVAAYGRRPNVTPVHLVLPWRWARWLGATSRVAELFRIGDLIQKRVIDVDHHGRASRRPASPCGSHPHGD
jgi:hypothetical protein